MNKMSFLDELLAVCPLMPIVKQAYDDGSADVMDAPAGMMSAESSPPQIAVIPDDADTRGATTLQATSEIKPGTLGPVTNSNVPIDMKRYNRVYEIGGDSA